MPKKSLLPKFPVLAGLDTKANPVIYHYCSLDTFLAIIQNRCLRLSDINAMNDYAEVHWAYDRFIEAVNIDIKKYEKEFVVYLDGLISEMQTHTLPLLACFSTDGDVLSQWRAYADNGAGVAVGFDAETVTRLAVRCAPVTYEPGEQVKYFREMMSAFYPMWKVSHNEEKMALLDEMVFLIAFDMCLMKNPAFNEEREVRIIRALNVDQKRGEWSLTDPGGSGTGDLASRKPQSVKFRARDGGIIAHIDLPIKGAGNKVVRDVVLGPRSQNNGVEVSMALSANKFTGFRIRPSQATYR